MTASPRVAIVGGGLAGLTVARQLNIKSPARGVDVEVFESADRVGGVISSSTDEGFVREHAANGVLGSAKGGAADLASDLGIDMVPASAAAKKRWIYARGSLHTLPSSPVSLAKSKLLSARGKLRLLAEPVRGGLPGEPTVAEFMRHRLGDEVHDMLVAPFVSGIYAGDTEELSMPAAFPRVSEIAAHGGLFRGILSEQLGGRRRKGSGSKAGSNARQTSAPSKGMGVIIERLAEKLTGRIRLDEPVSTIERSSRGVDIVTAAGKVEHFDAVVCAVPAESAVPMFRRADPELAELLSMIPTAPVAVVHLGYRRRDVGHALDGFGFLATPCAGLDILGVVFESSIWPNRAPSECVLLRCMIGGRRQADLVGEDDQATLARARRQCEEILEISAQPVHTNVVRWPRAIAQYTIGHRERLERAEELAADQGVVLAGASYHGVAVNSVTTDAARAALRIQQLLAAPIAFALCLLLSAALAACSGAGKTTPNVASDDGGYDAQRPIVDDDAQVRENAPTSAFVSGYTITEVSPETAGAIEVSVILPQPPAAAVDTGALNACEQPSRPQLVVHTLGGIVGAVVWLEDISTGRAETTQRGAIVQSLRGCRIEPRVAVVGRIDAVLEVTTSTEHRRELRIEFGDSTAALKPVATLPMAPIGRGFAIPTAAVGIYRTGGERLDPGWTIVRGTPYIAQTGPKGIARLEGVPAGEYALRVWHPPVAGNELAERKKVSVKAGAVAKTTIDLSAALTRASK